MTPTICNKYNKMQIKPNNTDQIFGGHPPEKGLCADALSYYALVEKKIPLPILC
jgi:hypothetical protein